MSNTVDNRVVSMEFDNKQFESGIKETITSLDNLKQALQFNTQATGLNTLQQQFNNFSLGNIESAVESLSHRFSSLGVVGMSVISNLTNKAMNFASRIEQATFGQITAGGKARAQKVADARFQLEGLFSKYEDGAERVEKAFKSANDAVDGTAYGLDAAVSTASQLATSGVELGEDMDGALRSIAGTAAMANSSFEEIGYIFNKVAAKNKLQGEDMISLSTRGISVLGVLGDYLGKTQEEVQSMVSKGQVDFKMFSNAMNEAFGDQAKRANETLSGALSNVRSALARIGEIFYSGIIENKEFIEMVNQLRLAINRVKDAIKPLQEPFATLVGSASKLGAAILKFFGYNTEFSSFIDMIATGMNTLSGWIDAFTAHVDAMRSALGLDDVVETAKTADKVLRSLTEREENAARAIWERGTFGNGIIREQMLEAAGLNYDNVQDLVNLIVANNGDINAAVEQYKKTVKSTAAETTEAVKETKEEVEETTTAIVPGQKALEHIVTLFNMAKQGIESIKKVIGSITRSFKKVFSWKDLSKSFNNFIKMVAEIGTALEVSDERAEKLEGIFSGLFSTIDLIRQAFEFLASVLSAVLSPVLSVIIDAFLWLGDKIGKSITKFNDFVKESRILNYILIKLRSTVSKITDWLGLFFEKFTQLPAVQKITDALADFSDEIKDNLLVYVDKAMSYLDDLFGVAENADTSTMDKALGTINTALENMLKFSGDAKGMLEKVYDKFKLIADPIAEATDTYTQLRQNITKTQLISGNLLKSNGIIGVMSTLSGYFDTVRDKLNGFVEVVVEKLRTFDYAKSILIGFSASVMTLLGTLSYMFFTFSNVAVSMETMFYSISGAFKAIAKRIYDPLNGKAKIIRAVAIALLALAGSLFIISKIPSDRLWDCVKAMSAILTIIGTFALAFTVLTKSLTVVESANLIQLLTQLSAVMLSLAGSVLILSVALTLLSTIPFEPMTTALGILTILLAEMTAVAVVISKFAPSISKGGISLLFLSGSVYLLVASLNKLSELNLDGIIEKLGIVGLCLITIGGIALLASKTTFSSMVGILAIVGSIWLIELALIDIMYYGVSMTEVLDHLDQFIPVLLVLGIVGGLMVALGVSGAKTVGVAGVIIAITVSIIAIMLAIKVLAKTYTEYGPEAYAMACMGIIAILGMLIIMVGVMQKAAVKVTGGARALISIAWMLAIMAVVLVLLGQIDDIEIIIQGIGALAALSVLATMLVAISQYSEKANHKAIAAMIGMIAAMALIIALLSLIPDKLAMWEAVGIFGSTLLALALSFYLICNQADKINEKKLLLMTLLIATIALSLSALLQYADDFIDVIGVAGALSVAMLAVGTAMAIINKTWPSSLDKKRLGEFGMMIGLVAVIGASLIGLTALGQDWKLVLVATYGLSLVIMAMALSLKEINRSWPNKLTKNQLLGFALMIGMVAVIGGALMGLTQIGITSGYINIISAAFALSMVMTVFIGMINMMTKSWPKNLRKRDFAAMAIVIGSVAAIGGVLMGLTAVGGAAGFHNILTAMVALSVVLYVFGDVLRYINASWPRGLTQNDMLGMIVLAGLIAYMGLTVMGLAAVGGKAGFHNVLVSAYALSMVIVVFGSMLGYITKEWPRGLTTDDLIGMAILIGLVTYIGLALMGISALGKDWGNILAAAYGMSAVMVAFAGMLSIISQIRLGVNDTAVLALASLSLIPIAIALTMLSKFDWRAIISASVMMGVALYLLTGTIVALAAINYAIPGSVTVILESLVPPLVAMSAVLLTLALSISAFTRCIPTLVKGLMDLTKINYNNIHVTVIFELIAAVAALGVAMFVFAAGLTKVAMALSVTGAAAVILGVGLSYLMIPILVLTSNINNLVKGIAALGASGKTYAAGISALAKAMKNDLATIFISLVRAITSSLVELAKSQPLIISSCMTIMTTIQSLLYTWLDKITEIVVIGILNLTETIAINAPKIVDNLLIIIDTFLEGITKYAGKLSKYSMVLVYSFVIGALTGLELMFPIFLERIASLVLTIIESVAQVLYNNQDRISNAVRAIIDIVGLTLFNILNELFGGLLENIGWYKGIENELSANVQRIAAQQGKDTASTVSDSYQKQMGEESSSISDATSSAFGGAMDDTSEVAERKANLLGGLTTDGIVNKVKSGASDLKDGFQSLFDNGTKGIDTSGVSDLYDEATGKRLQVGDTVSGKTRQVINRRVANLTDAEVQAFYEQGWKVDEANQDLLYKIVGEDYKVTAADVVGNIYGSDTVVSAASDAAGTVKDNYYGTLTNLSNSEISSYSQDVSGNIQKIMVDSTEDTLDINSPSKVAIGISGYFMQGLANGVKNNMGLVTSACDGIGTQITDATKEGLYAFSDLLGSDKEWQPTITPVVDTTNIENAKTLVDDTFDNNSFKMAANASVSVGDSTQSALAAQVAMLTDQVAKLANADYSKMLEGVQINIDASTKVDGTTLRQTSAKYTIQTMDDQQRAYIMSRGGRA